MIGFKRLSDEVINKYNYRETRKNVDQFMEPLYELIFKFNSISPPRISMVISDVNIQHSVNTTSQVEKYVIKKLDTEKEVKKYYDIIESIVSKLRPDEQMCFKAEYLDPMDEETLADKLSISVWTVVQIRKSCIIKFALALDLAVLKGE